jgi:hypothetical protein
MQIYKKYIRIKLEESILVLLLMKEDYYIWQK